MNNEINLTTLFATYWGAECRYTFFDDEVTDIMNEVVDDRCLTRISNDYYKDFYLKLTPLSAITDEDAIEVAKMINKGETDKYFMCDSSIVKRGYQLGAPRTGILFIQLIIDYLRSKGYDCGYMHITSLIESGYAIDKTNLI